jgi:hypothetical protein
LRENTWTQSSKDTHEVCRQDCIHLVQFVGIQNPHSDVREWSSEKSLFRQHKCVIKVEPQTKTIAVDGPTLGTISRSKTRKFHGACFTKDNRQSWEWI